MIAPAGHGAGQFDGYRVVPRVMAMFSVLVLPCTLWNEPLSEMPHAIGYVPASLNCFRNGSSFSRSSQNRSVFGLSGAVQVTSCCRSNENPPKSCAPAPGRARNSTL